MRNVCFRADERQRFTEILIHITMEEIIDKFKIGKVYNSAGELIEEVRLKDALKFDHKKYVDQMPITVRWYECTIKHDTMDVVRYDKPRKESK